MALTGETVLFGYVVPMLLPRNSQKYLHNSNNTIKRFNIQYTRKFKK